jgi:hypothetical protein
VAVRLRDTIPLIERLPGNGISGLAEMLDEVPMGDLLVVDSYRRWDRRAALDEELAEAVSRLKTTAVERRKPFF